MSKSSTPALSRRGMLIGAGTAGATAVALATVPQAAKSPVAAVAPQEVPEQGGGYRLSPHVVRYYQTAKV